MRCAQRPQLSVFAMLFSPRFSPLLTGAVCGTILLGLGLLFVSQLHRLSARLNDPVVVRSELQRIMQAARPKQEVPAPDAIHRGPSPRPAEAVVAEIETRMRALGAPLWKDQANVLKRAFASGDHLAATPAAIPDDVIGKTAPVLSPRQVQILALVQAESRWAESMRTEETRRPDADFSLR